MICWNYAGDLETPNGIDVGQFVYYKGRVGTIIDAETLASVSFVKDRQVVKVLWADDADTRGLFTSTVDLEHKVDHQRMYREMLQNVEPIPDGEEESLSDESCGIS